MNELLDTLKRVGFDLILSLVLMIALFFQTSYFDFSTGFSLVLYKALLVSLGFVHAHITRKIAFPKVNWETSEHQIYLKYLVIALYVVFIYAYSQGG